MPGPLKNARHERFAQELAKGATMLDAYAAADYAPNRGHASRLAANGNIVARVSELKGKAAERTLVTVASLTQRLLNIAEKGENSREAPLLSVARASIMDVAKLNGLIIDKTQRELSQEQMDALMDVVRSQPGLAAQMLAQMGIG